MKLGNNFVPEGLIDSLKAGVPGFERESYKDQQGLAFLVWSSLQKWREHKSKAGHIAISYKELNDRFGRGRFRAINERLRVFSVSDNWSHAQSLTRSFALMPAAAACLQRFLTDLSGGRLIGPKGTPARISAVASRDANNQTTTAWQAASALGEVPINMATLTRLLEWFEACLARARQGLLPAQADPRHLIELLCTARDRTAQVIVLSKTPGRAGTMRHHYQQAASGRLYAKGVNLQSAPTYIRQAALAGNYEYDIENCHVQIVLQIAEAAGIACPHIAQYARDKQGIREQIAQAAGISGDEAKQVLIAILYGATPSGRRQSAIATIVGESATAGRVLQVPFVAAFFDEVANARRHIVSTAPAAGNGRRINAFGKELPQGSPSQVLAHILQGVEATALKACIDSYPDDIILVQHDGFVAKRPLDRKVLESAIERATGYKLTISCELLTAPHQDPECNPDRLFAQYPSGLSYVSG